MDRPVDRYDLPVNSIEKLPSPVLICFAEAGKRFEPAFFRPGPIGRILMSCPVFEENGAMRVEIDEVVEEIPFSNELAIESISAMNVCGYRLAQSARCLFNCLTM